MRMRGSPQARRAFVMILYPLEQVAVVMTVGAPLLQPWGLSWLLLASLVGALGAGLRAHWFSVLCWLAAAAWFGLGAPWPVGAG